MSPASPSPVQQIIQQADASLLDIVDHVLNQGVVIKGEVMLGVANVDLIYLGLSLVLCSADRVLPPAAEQTPRRRSRRPPRRPKP